MPQPSKTKRQADKARQKYKLLAGIHVGQDYSQEPARLEDQRTGEVTLKYPSKTYAKGDVVESEIDLVKQCGDEKFALVTKERERRRGEREDDDEEVQGRSATFDPGQSVAPGGQVGTGLQGANTTGTPGSHLVEPTGPEQLPATPPDLKKLQQEGEAKEVREVKEGEKKEDHPVPASKASEGPKPVPQVTQPQHGTTHQGHKKTGR